MDHADASSPVRRLSSRIEAWAAQHPWLMVCLAIVGAAGAALSFNVGTETPERTELVERNGHQFLEKTGGGNTPGWATGAAFLSILVVAFALAYLLEGSKRRSLRVADRRRERIAKLSTSLTEALGIIEAIKNEVADGEKVLADLESELEVTEQLAQLSTVEANAVLSRLKETVRVETSRGTRLQFVFGLIFFLAGIAATLLLTR